MLFIPWIEFNYSVEIQQANTIMMEEQLEQTEGEDEEEQDGMLKMELQ